MRLAFIADIHGDPIALEAVLRQIEAEGGVDGYWFLGDYCAVGYDPVTVLERVTALPNAVFIRGNTDRYLYSGQPPGPSPDDVAKNPALLTIYAELQRTFAWTQGYLVRNGWLDWLEALPLELRLTLPDGTRLLAVHASPGTDDGWGVYPTLTQDALAAMLAAADADLVLVGHTHAPQDYQVNGGQIVNPGSVGNPMGTDVRAAYAILTADANGHSIELKRVAYDVTAVLDQLKKERHPAAGYIARFYEGRYVPFWVKE